MWHQFSAVDKPPAFFAISVHTDETGGNLRPELLAQVRANQATIAALTEVIPSSVQELLQKPTVLASVPRFVCSVGSC